MIITFADKHVSPDGAHLKRRSGSGGGQRHIGGGERSRSVENAQTWNGERPQKALQQG